MPQIVQSGRPLIRNASSVATELIREAILDGSLSPGERLKEEELAQRLGISRTPVREALLVLQTEGLVEATPNRGATVRAHDADDLDDLYQLRAVLEGHAAHQAAVRATDEVIVALQVSCERFAELMTGDDVRAIVQENLFFHRSVLETAGSARLASMVRKVVEIPLVYKSYIWYSPGERETSVQFHRQITHALELRDAERAERVMKEHVFAARDLLVARVRELEEGA